MPPAALPDLHRLLVAADGRCKAQFADNSIMLLNCAGSAFVAVPGNNKADAPSCNTHTRQLSEYALTRHTPQLTVMLEFRNMHMDQSFFCKPLLRCTRPAFSLGYTIREVWWPSSIAEAEQQVLLQHLPDGRIALGSVDGCARAVLHFHRRRVAVCYPLLVQLSPREGRHEYVWHTQVFSLQACPARWRMAVHLLLQAAQATNNGSSLEVPPAENLLPQPGQHLQQQQCTVRPAASTARPHSSSGHSPPLTAAPGPASMQLVLHPTSQHQDNAQRPSSPHSEQPGDRVVKADRLPPALSELPTALERDLGAICSGFDEGSWWFEPSHTLLPPRVQTTDGTTCNNKGSGSSSSNDCIVLEWTPEATYQYHPDGQEVEVWIHADESCLHSISHGRYLVHSRGPTHPEQMYAASSVPNATWSRDLGQRLNLGQLAAHALKLRSQMAANCAAQSAALDSTNGGTAASSGGALLPSATAAHLQQKHSRTASDALADSFAVQSEAILESCDMAAIGTLTAYADGRVRVNFTDRTILHMNSSRSHCRLYMRDGQHLLVSVANPIGVEQYVAAAKEFAAWAYTPAEQRTAQVRDRAAVAAELASSHRMVQLCDWGATGRVPLGVRNGQGQVTGVLGWEEGELYAKTMALEGEKASRWGKVQGHGSTVSTEFEHAGLSDKTDMQQAVEALLQRNAELIGRL